MRLRMERLVHTIIIEYEGETGTFEIKPLTPEENEVIQIKHTPARKWNNNQMVEKAPCYVDMQIEKVQKTIVGWDVKDESGKDVECNAANKRAAWLLNPDAINKVLIKASLIADGLKEQQEDELGN